MKKIGKRKKQIARKGIHTDKTTKNEAEEDMEAIKKGDSSLGTDILINPVQVDIKPPSIANWKIIKLELYRLVLQRYGTNGPEDDALLNLESADIYMLTERRYPLPADVCQAMLDKKLQGDKRDEACYQLLKLIEKQAIISYLEIKVFRKVSQ
ncbi:hypothetical protein Tco_1064135 [Tanacetum coccineum]